MQAVVELDGLSHVYVNGRGATMALQQISLHVNQGEFVSLIGPSGCGKTTLLSLISGLLTPTQGSVRISGEWIKQPSPKVGYMLQQDYLFPWRTIYENASIGLELMGKRDAASKALVLELLHDMGLSDYAESYPQQLSGGMRQRVALVRTLATEPDILLLDEPFSALDYQTKLQLEDLVAVTLRSRNKTAVLVTHDISEAIAMSDRIIVMQPRPGRIRAEVDVPQSIRLALPLKAREEAGFHDLFHLLWGQFDDMDADRGGRMNDLTPLNHSQNYAHDEHLTKQEFERYKARERRTTHQVRITQWTILLLFMGWWEAAGRLQWIDTLLFSYPSRIGVLLYTKLVDGSLLLHVGVTLWETIAGFLLGTLFGTAIATLIWWSPFLSRVLDPYIVVLNSLPKVALGPLFIVALGPGVLSIIATTLSITVIITILTVYGSFKEVDPNYTKVIRIFGGNKRKVYQNVILPASYPTIVSTLKVNVGLSWVGVIVGEFLVSKEGLGYLIIYGFQVFNFTLVIGSVIIIAIAATVMYQGVAYLEGKLIGNKRR